MDLSQLVLYASIPSVQRVVIHAGLSEHWSGTFSRWPVDLPLSNAAEVFFVGSCVVPADAVAFANGFAGPCIMRQTWVEHGSWHMKGDRGLEWNHLEIIGSGPECEIFCVGCNRADSSVEMALRQAVTINGQHY